MFGIFVSERTGMMLGLGGAEHGKSFSTVKPPNIKLIYISSGSDSSVDFWQLSRV